MNASRSRVLSELRKNPLFDSVLEDTLVDSLETRSRLSRVQLQEAGATDELITLYENCEVQAPPPPPNQLPQAPNLPMVAYITAGTVLLAFAVTYLND